MEVKTVSEGRDKEQLPAGARVVVNWHLTCGPFQAILRIFNLILWNSRKEDIT